MTDLEKIEYAIQVVLERCRKENPYHLNIPASGASVMEWFATALNEAKSLDK